MEGAAGNDMVERVAAAIKRTRLHGADAQARAAIAAMREPTQAMLTPDNEFDEVRFDAHRRDDDAAIWRAMIDAALSTDPAGTEKD